MQYSKDHFDKVLAGMRLRGHVGSEANTLGLLEYNSSFHEELVKKLKDGQERSHEQRNSSYKGGDINPHYEKAHKATLIPIKVGNSYALLKVEESNRPYDEASYDLYLSNNSNASQSIKSVIERAITEVYPRQRENGQFRSQTINCRDIDTGPLILENIENISKGSGPKVNFTTHDIDAVRTKHNACITNRVAFHQDKPKQSLPISTPNPMINSIYSGKSMSNVPEHNDVNLAQRQTNQYAAHADSLAEHRHELEKRRSKVKDYHPSFIARAGLALALTAIVGITAATLLPVAAAIALTVVTFTAATAGPPLAQHSAQKELKREIDHTSHRIADDEANIANIKSKFNVSPTNSERYWSNKEEKRNAARERQSIQK